MPTREAHELALQAWVARAVADLAVTIGAPIAVVFANQPLEAPRPAKPYVSILLLTDRALGSTPNARTTDTPSGADFETERDYQRQGTVSFTAYGDRHREIVKLLEYATDDDSLIAQADAEGLTVSHMISAIREPRKLLDTGFEERSIADFVFRYVEVVTGTTPVIETVNATSTVTVG